MANPLGGKLLEVRKPGRYIGGEFGAYNKPWDSARIRWCLAFPDIYEIGMSHLGLQILYHVLNGEEDILADRVFAPWFDMEALLVREGVLLYGLESGRPLKDFDIIGITIPYELTYTNIVSLLKLGGIPVFSHERGKGDPLVIGGGSGAFNPEPVADFFDAILIGDGEEAVVEVSSVVSDNEAGSMDDLLEKLSEIKGVYIPRFGTARCVRRRTLADLDSVKHPPRVLVPNVSVTHDRIGIEIQRGCARGCRFCQSGIVYRPVRQASPAKVVDAAEAGIHFSGFEECAFLSLSAGDYDYLTDVIKKIDGDMREMWVHISLPSLRTEAFDMETVSALSRSLKGGFTLAPEAATEPLRRVINKGNTEANLLDSIERIFLSGWHKLKLYFMIGLPTETERDVKAIAELARKALDIGRKFHRHPNITVNVSTFVPKSHTPFQWERQILITEIKRLHRILKDAVKGSGLKLKLHLPEMTFLEGVFSRGGRELSSVIVEAHNKGCRFDAWDDKLKFDTWIGVFKECGVEPEKYLGERTEDARLPWDHLFTDIKKSFLISERKKSRREELTPDCNRAVCASCGVCDFKTVKPIIFPKKEQDAKYKIQNTLYKARETKIYRYRIDFIKTGVATLIGHLDFMNIFRRSLRRAGLPLRYTEGFNPRPRMSFSDPIKVGVEGEGWVKIEITKDIAPHDVAKLLEKQFPAGIIIKGVIREIS